MLKLTAQTSITSVIHSTWTFGWSFINPSPSPLNRRLCFYGKEGGRTSLLIWRSTVDRRRRQLCTNNEL